MPATSPQASSPAPSGLSKPRQLLATARSDLNALHLDARLVNADVVQRRIVIIDAVLGDLERLMAAEAAAQNQIAEVQSHLNTALDALMVIAFGTAESRYRDRHLLLADVCATARRAYHELAGMHRTPPSSLWHCPEAASSAGLLPHLGRAREGKHFGATDQKQPGADTTAPASPPAAGKPAEPHKPFTTPVHTFEVVAAGCGEDRPPSSHARCMAIEVDLYGEQDQQRRTLQATFDALAQSFLRRDPLAPGQNLDVKA